MTANAYSVSTPASVVGVSFCCRASHWQAKASSADSLSDGRAGSGDEETVDTADGTRAALAALRWRGGAGQARGKGKGGALALWTNTAVSSAAG
jgi:hypothetical protein